MKSATRAFTLIELLVVISIIAMLSILLLTLIPRIRDSTRTTVCASHQRQVAMAVLSVAQERRGVLPASDPYDRGPYPWPTAIAGNTMWTLLDDYDVPLQAWWCRANISFTEPFIVSIDNVRLTETEARATPYGGRVCMSYQYFGPYVAGDWSWELRNLRTASPAQVLLADFTMIEGPNFYAQHRLGRRVISNQAFVDGSVQSLPYSELENYFTNTAYHFYAKLRNDG